MCDLCDVTVCVKTFNRPKLLNNCLKSIRWNYPNIKIIVADDGNINQNIGFDVEYHKLKFDKGLSYGRNFMLDKVKTKYFVLVDDYFIFTPETNLKKLKKKII